MEGHHIPVHTKPLPDSDNQIHQKKVKVAAIYQPKIFQEIKANMIVVFIDNGQLGVMKRISWEIKIV